MSTLTNDDMAVLGIMHTLAYEAVCCVLAILEANNHNKPQKHPPHGDVQTEVRFPWSAATPHVEARTAMRVLLPLQYIGPLGW
jgi:hypothetical protein